MSQRVQLIISAADLHFEKDIFYVCKGISIEPDHKVHIRSKQWPSPSRFIVTLHSFLNRLWFCTDAFDTWNNLFDFV